MTHTYTHRTFDSHSEREHRLAYELPAAPDRPVVPTPEAPADGNLRIGAGGPINKLQEQANVLRGRLNQLADITKDKKLTDAADAVQQKMNALLQRQSYETGTLDAAINSKVEEVYKTIQEAEAVLRTAQEVQNNPANFRAIGPDVNGWQQYSFDLPGDLNGPGPVYWFNGRMHSMGYSCEPFSRFNAGATVDNTIGGPEFSFRVVREDMGGGKLRYTLRVNPSFTDETGRNPGVINIGTSGANILRTNAVPAALPPQESVLKDLDQKDVKGELAGALRPAPVPVAPPSTLPPVIVPPGSAPEGSGRSVDVLLKATAEWVMMKDLGVNEEAWKNSYVRRIGSIVYAAEKGSNEISKILGNSADGRVTFARLAPAEKHTFLTASLSSGVLHDGTAPGLLPSWEYAHNNDTVVARRKTTSIYKCFTKDTDDWGGITFAVIPDNLKPLFATVAAPAGPSGLPPIVPPPGGGAPEGAPEAEQGRLALEALQNAKNGYPNVVAKPEELRPLIEAVNTKYLPGLKTERGAAYTTYLPFTDNAVQGHPNWHVVFNGTSGKFELVDRTAENAERARASLEALQNAKNGYPRAVTDVAELRPLIDAANTYYLPSLRAQHGPTAYTPYLPFTDNAVQGHPDWHVVFNGTKGDFELVERRPTAPDVVDVDREQLGKAQAALREAQANAGKVSPTGYSVEDLKPVQDKCDIVTTALAAMSPEGRTAAITTLGLTAPIVLDVKIFRATDDLEIALDGNKVVVRERTTTPAPAPRETESRATELPTDKPAVIGGAPVELVVDQKDTLTLTIPGDPDAVVLGPDTVFVDRSTVSVVRERGTNKVTVTVKAGAPEGSYTLTTGTKNGSILAKKEGPAEAKTELPAAGTVLPRNVETPFSVKIGTEVKITGPTDPTLPITLNPDSRGVVGGMPVEHKGTTVVMKPDNDSRAGTYTIEVDGLPPTTVVLPALAPVAPPPRPGGPAAGPGTEPPLGPAEKIDANLPVSVDLQVGQPTAFTVPVGPTVGLSVVNPDGTSWSGDLASVATTGGTRTENGVTVTVADTVPPSGSWNVTVTFINPLEDGQASRSHTVSVAGKNMNVNILPPGLTPGIEPPPAPATGPKEKPVETKLPTSGLVLERYKGETFLVKKDAKVTITRLGGASSEFAPGRTDNVDGLAVSYNGTSVTIEANSGTAPGEYMIEVPNGLAMLSTIVTVPELPPAAPFVPSAPTARVVGAAADGTANVVGAVADAAVGSVNKGVKLLADVLKGLTDRTLPIGAGAPPEGGAGALPPTAPEAEPFLGGFPQNVETIVGNTTAFLVPENTQFNIKVPGTNSFIVAPGPESVGAAPSTIQGVTMSRVAAPDGQNVIRISFATGALQGSYEFVGKDSAVGRLGNIILKPVEVRREDFPQRLDAKIGKAVSFRVPRGAEFNLRVPGTNTYLVMPGPEGVGAPASTNEGVTVTRQTASGAQDLITYTFTREAKPGIYDIVAKTEHRPLGSVVVKP
jgi:hypothetical protein